MEYPLLAIDVADEHVQRADPLLEPGLRALPFAAREHARDQVERQGSIDVAAVGIKGERDARHARDRARSNLARGDVAVRKLREIADEMAGGGPRAAVGRDQLVKRGAPVVRPIYRSTQFRPGRFY